MKILIVDCYESTKKGRQAYNAYFRTLEAAIKASGPFSAEISLVHRELTNVGDHVLDWETEALNEDAKSRASKFDSIDIICVAGDMQTCPWDPRYMKVVTLIHMANLVKKPVLGLGSGAFASVYACATNGARFHMLNEPYGLPYNKLATFPRYSKGTKAFPSGWLNNETGDVFTYSEEYKLWKPVCNVGMFRIATAGKPTPIAPGMSAPKHMGKDDRSLTEEQDPSALYIDDRETSTHIRNAFIQNRFLTGLMSQNFIACELPNWHLNGDGALPTTKGIFVMAENKMGPVILGKGSNHLYLACEINQGKSYDTMRHIMTNYVGAVVADVRAEEQPADSLVLYLFGDSAGRGSSYDSTLSSAGDMAPTLTATAVASSLPGGPTRVAMPVFELFFKDKDEMAAVNLPPGALSGNKKSSSKGGKTKKQMRHPLMSRRKRLDALFKMTGNEDMSGKMKRVLAESEARDPYGYDKDGDAAAGASFLHEMSEGYTSDPNSQSKVAGNLRQQRDAYRRQVEMEERNNEAAQRRWARKQRREEKLKAKGMNMAAHPLEEFSDSMSLTSLTSDDYSIGGELVKVGDRVMRIERQDDNRGTFGERTLSTMAIKSKDPPPDLIPNVAEPLSKGPSDWIKLQAKMMDDEDERKRLHNDKTRVVDWANENSKLQDRNPSSGNVKFSSIEAQYREHRKQLTYEPPDSPDRMKRDGREMRMLKQRSQGVMERPGTAPNAHRPIKPSTAPRDANNNRAGTAPGMQRPNKVAGHPTRKLFSRGSQAGPSKGNAPQRPLSGSSLTAKHIPRPKTTPGAVRLASGKRRPFNNATKFAEMHVKDEEGPYLGRYTEPYMTPYEQDAAYIRKNKDKWSGGHFRLAFGQGKGLPLRKDGLIGGDGMYPEKCKDGSAEHVKGVDWLLVRRVNKDKQIAGAWRPGTSH